MSKCSTFQPLAGHKYRIFKIQNPQNSNDVQEVSILTLLGNENSEAIFKLVDNEELAFYQLINRIEITISNSRAYKFINDKGNSKSFKDIQKSIKFLLEFTPRLHDIVKISKINQVYPDVLSDKNLSINILSSLLPQNPDSQFSNYIKLKNYSKNQIAVCDIKIGKQTYSPDACIEKKKIMNQKISESQKKFGYRILGLQMPDGQVISKNSCGKKNMQERITELNLMNFLAQADCIVIDDIIDRLDRLTNFFLTENKSFSFYSSSLLISYGPLGTIVKMIDFSHVYYDYDGNENYLHGLRSLRNHFDEYREKLMIQNKI